jgi:hypothetical protein
MEVYLYVCEVCGLVKYNEIDKGSVLIVMCKGCGLVEFHKKVVIKENKFVIEEKQKDDNTYKETDKA